MLRLLSRARPRTTAAARRVVLVWLIVLAAGIACAGPLFAALTDDTGRADTESSRTSTALKAASPTGQRLFAVIDAAPGNAAVRRQIVAAARDLRAIGGVRRVVTAVDRQATPAAADEQSGLLTADDGRATVVVVELSAKLTDHAVGPTVTAVRSRLHRVTGARVLVGGDTLVQRDATAGARRDLVRAEAITLPVAFLAMIVIFGGVFAALVPFLTAVACIGAALLILLATAHTTAVSAYAVNVVTMFGLGLSIDYGLLVVTRFREERYAGADVADAVARADATAGRTLTYSALTVVAALLGLFVFTDPTLVSLAVGGIAITSVALLAGRTLLPALLLLAGHRIRPGRPPGEHGGFARLARAVTRRPLAVAAGVSVLLLLTAAPLLHAHFALGDYHVLPRSAEARQAAQQVQSRFPGRVDDTVVVLAGTGARDPALASWLTRLRRLPTVTAVTARDGVPAGLVALDLHVSGDPQGKAARAVVTAVRESRPAVPFRIGVTGDAATLIDYEHRLATRLPLAVLVVLLATGSLLFLMTGSVIVPLKAVAVAFLSLSSAMGVLVWGFQDGHLAGLLGVDSTGSLQSQVPLILFVFAYGLSIDYEAFLLSRIQEAHDQGLETGRAVAAGLQRTGRLITCAALLVVLVFVGFATGDVLFVQQMGVGLAVAVVVDATVVRCLLVPAVMALLGSRNWWAPAPLARLHARFVGATQRGTRTADKGPDEGPDEGRDAGRRPGARPLRPPATSLH